MKKVSEWLVEHVDSHTIYNSNELEKSFQTETGLEAKWPIHSRTATKEMLKRRGLGGQLDEGEPNERLCWGYEVAEYLATKHTDYDCGHIQGRGSRFNLAVKCLENVSM